MAETWEVEVGGQTYDVEADTPQQAVTFARLLAAREQGVAQAEQGAMARSAAPSAANENLSPTEELARAREVGAKNVPGWAVPATLGLITAPGMVSAAIANPGATAASLGTGYLGGEAGERVGRFLEGYGAPAGTSKGLGLVGGLAGGAYGFAKGQTLARDLVKAGIGRHGMLGPLLERLAGTEAAPAATVASETVTKAAAQRAEETARRLALAERKVAAMEERNLLARMKFEAKAGKAIPKPSTEATARVVEPAPEPLQILPAGQRAPATNLGGKAKPGPAPTPPEDLEETLRRSIEAAKARKAAAAAESPLRQPRLEVGAEKVGRGAGLMKEEVRLQTGPRLNETLGEASPILPDVPFNKIVDTLKALPKTGGFREAYVARATSGKTMAQVENIRRTLERLGLLLPLGAVGAAAMNRGSED